MASTKIEKQAHWIEHAMSISHLNVSELANRLHITHSYLYRILSLKTDVRLSTLFKIIDACGFEIVELRVRRKPNLEL